MQAGGGVVRIVHDGDISAWRRFDAVLKKTFADMHPRSVSIRIDSHWHTTRFLADILAEFDRKLSEAGLSHGGPVDRLGDVAIMTGNQVGGNAEFHVGTINLGGSVADQVKRRDLAVADVCTRCDTLLKRGDRLMIVVHHGDDRSQAAFWCDLWQRGLSDLISEGMMLVHYVEGGQTIHGHAPDPAETIVLPRDLSDESREGDAYDDLIDMLMGLDIVKDTAVGLALAHVNSNKRSMDDFYNNLTSLVMKVRQQAMKQ